MDGAIREKITPVSIDAPINLKERSDFSFYSKEALTYSIVVYEHKNVFVAASGVCFNRLGQLLPGSFMHLKRVKKDQKKIALFNLLFRKKKKLDPRKQYLVIHNQWSINGYYHWIIDSMPRLWSVKDRLHELCLLLPESAKQNQFIQGTLSFFPGVQVEYLEGRKVAFVKSLVLPSHLPYWGILEPAFLKQFRNYIVGKSALRSSDRFIYISRKNATRRKIINEDEVVEELQKFGFANYNLEQLSFQEQISLFKNAKLVVSIHGAGLTNLVFMESGSSVIEFIKHPREGESYLMEYQRLAHLFDIDYYSLPCRPGHPEASLDAADLKVDVPELRRLLEEASKKITN